MLIAGLLASLWTAGRRLMVERDGRTVELTVDMDQLRDQAVSAGVPLPDALDELKRAGVISTGMLPKVDSAIAAIESGVEKVQFVDGGIPHSVLLEIFTDSGVGTEVVR